MEEKDHLFSDFRTLSRKTWEARVQKELKGRPLEDLKWQLGEYVELEPYYFREDLPENSQTLRADRTNNEWEIGEEIEVGLARATNMLLLEALKNGVNAPCLSWSGQPEIFELEDLLAGVHATYLSTHFETAAGPYRLLQEFHHLQKSREVDPGQLRGSINGASLLNTDEGKEFLQYGIQHFPLFKLLTVDGADLYGGTDRVVEELAGLLTRATDYLVQAGQLGITPEQMTPRLQFSVYLGTSYFVELAKLRALRLLWPLLLKGFEVDPSLSTTIAVRFAPETQVDDPDLNLIRAGTQALSAVIGGADRLTVLPPDAFKEKPSSFSRRMARNIQHILSMESYLDRVVDPAAGSYYIEVLTERLAEAAWKVFQQREKSGRR